MHRRSAVSIVLAALVVSGCSQDTSTDQGAQELLATAKAKLDQASSAHVTVTSKNVPETGTALLGGEGVAARPDQFEGSLDVFFAGTSASVDVVSTDGKVYAKLPFATGFAITDPAQFGFADPGAFLNPDTGLSSLLVETDDAAVAGERRVGGEVVAEIETSIPGTVIERLLASADPTAPVEATFLVVKTSGELRQAVVTGPFFQKGTDSTFTITLDRYGEKVDISAPSTG